MQTFIFSRVWALSATAFVLLASVGTASAQERRDAAGASYEAVSVPEAPHRHASGESDSTVARAGLIGGQTLHGMALGFELCGLLNCGDGRAFLASGMLGAGAGFTTSFLASRGGVTPGLTASVNSGVLWGAYLGFVVPQAFDGSANERLVLGKVIGSQLFGMGAGYLAYRIWEPSSGQVATANSAGMWLSAMSLAGAHTFADLSSEGAMALLGGGSIAGLVLGSLLASHVSMSDGRVLLINASGLLGGLVGLSLPILAVGDDASTQAITGFGTFGALTGLVVGYLLTRTWDIPDAPNAQLGFAPVQGGAVVTAQVQL